MPRRRKGRILQICNLHIFEGLKRLQPIENSAVSTARSSQLARHGGDPCNRLPFHLQISGISVDRFQDVFRMYPGSISILFAGFGGSGFAQERAI